MYDSKYSFSEYRNLKKYSDLSSTTKYNRLLSFYHWLNDFRNFALLTVKTTMKKKRVCKNSTNLYNKLLTIYFNDYKYIKDKKKEEMDKNMILVIYFLKVLNIISWKKKEKKKGWRTN